MLRNAAINTVEENRAILHWHKQEGKGAPRLQCLQADSVHAPFETPLSISLGKNKCTYNRKCMGETNKQYRGNIDRYLKCCILNLVGKKHIGCKYVLVFHVEMRY